MAEAGASVDVPPPLPTCVLTVNRAAAAFADVLVADNRVAGPERQNHSSIPYHPVS